MKHPKMGQQPVDEEALHSSLLPSRANVLLYPFIFFLNIFKYFFKKIKLSEVSIIASLICQVILEYVQQSIFSHDELNLVHMIFKNLIFPPH